MKEDNALLISSFKLDRRLQDIINMSADHS